MLLSLTTFNVCPELRPLCSTGIARLRRSYWPLGQVSQQFSVSPGLSSTNRFAGNTIELLLATMRTPSKLWRVVVRRLGCCSPPCRRFPANGCPLLTENICNLDGQLLAGRRLSKVASLCLKGLRLRSVSPPFCTRAESQPVLNQQCQ